MRHLFHRFTALRLAWAVLVATVASAANGCASMHSFVVDRPKDPRIDTAYTAIWTDEIERDGQDGDIVLRRGYAALSDVIAFVSVDSGGDDADNLTHAAVYDAHARTVIEAVNPEVREVPLADFVRSSHRVVLLRPNLSAAARRRVVKRARSQVGAGFDYSGFVGVDDPERFYCSELVAWALSTEMDVHAGNLVEPSELLGYGTVLFDSGPRTEDGPTTPPTTMAAR
jgi:hypothetical protein